MKVTKKVIGLLVVFMLFVSTIGSIQASEDGLSKAKKYYQQVEDKELSYADEILAIEAIGLEVEDSKNGFNISEFLETDFTTQGAGALGKSILALCLVNENPRDINGKDLVALLESYYQADGSFENKSTSDWVTVGTVPFDVIALKTVGSTLDMSKTITYFTSQQDKSGAFGYQYNGFNVEYASTAWAMMALDYLGESTASIKAKTFLDSSIDSTLHGWNQYGTLDANNQASVLWGLYELGHTEYQKEFQALLTFQCQDGSFGFKDNLQSNAMATQQAMLALGVKYNGSIIDKAIAEYKETMTPPKKEETVVSKDGLTEVKGVLPAGTTVQAQQIKDTSAFKNQLINDLKVDVKQIVVFDISLLDANGQHIQPGTNVTVKIKAPVGFSDDMLLYHQRADGSLINVTFTLENGYMIFITDSFSKFIIVEKQPVKEEPVKEETDQKEIVKTGDATQIYVLAMTGMISLLGIIVVEKKKKI